MFSYTLEIYLFKLIIFCRDHVTPMVDVRFYSDKNVPVQGDLYRYFGVISVCETGRVYFGVNHSDTIAPLKLPVDNIFLQSIASR